MPPLPLPGLLSMTSPSRISRPGLTVPSLTPIIDPMRTLESWGTCLEMPQDDRPLHAPLRLVTCTERCTFSPVKHVFFEVMIGAGKGRRPHDQRERLSNPNYHMNTHIDPRLDSILSYLKDSRLNLNASLHPGSAYLAYPRATVQYNGTAGTHSEGHVCLRHNQTRGLSARNRISY